MILSRCRSPSWATGRSELTEPSALHGRPRIAAVLLLIYPRNGIPHIVFTRRTETLARHQGQISLPGGSRDPGDPTLEATALRETEEEIGVPTRDVDLWGRVGD